jgi:hypothetical protein
LAKDGVCTAKSFLRIFDANFRAIGKNIVYLKFERIRGLARHLLDFGPQNNQGFARHCADLVQLGHVSRSFAATADLP